GRSKNWGLELPISLKKFFSPKKIVSSPTSFCGIYPDRLSLFLMGVAVRKRTGRLKNGSSGSQAKGGYQGSTVSGFLWLLSRARQIRRRSRNWDMLGKTTMFVS